ncbi:type IV-A pilus assembly ATPase PilB [Candidatus Sumerlaeota bacterium]|nr:type IV-A pilus assembly ATPase PilB [Candidatus Sumerlaeota bacterium]
MATKLERQLGEMLVKENVISGDQLEKALLRQAEDGHSLGHVIVDLGMASEWEMAAALGKHLNVPFVTLSHYEIDEQILHSIDEEIVKKYKIIPVDKTGDTLMIALSDPSNIYLLDELRLLTKCKIVPVISFESDIEEAIQRYYTNSENSFDEMLKDITDTDIDQISTIIGSNDDDTDESDLTLDADDAPVIQLVNLLISEAINMRASDIHIEPYEKSLRVRYRVDGALREMTPPPKKFQNAITSRIKILSNLDIAEKRKPQDGNFRVNREGQKIDFRVSVCPTVYGEKVVIRILDRGNLMLDLTDLGFEPEVLETFTAQIHLPWGMILVTGPTGSGKTTTLYSALNTINEPSKNIMTVEDPVEYQLHGINQVQIRPDIGLSFAEGLRSFLRQDPDVILVGEIRDMETAEIGVKAALTGHLVFSTLHTNDAPSSVNRLTNMGVPPFLVTASVNMIIAQRLSRRICERCKTDFRPPASTLEDLGLTAEELQSNPAFKKGAGCDHCVGTGYRGRLALYELMLVSDTIKQMIIEGEPSTVLKRQAIQEGMRSLRMSGNRKAMQGATSIEEVLSVTMADS